MHAGAPVSASTFGPEPGGRARARRRLPFLRRDPAGPRCGEPPADDHDDEGRAHVLAALAELMRADGVDPGPRCTP